jgi:hypothetical protein
MLGVFRALAERQQIKRKPVVCWFWGVFWHASIVGSARCGVD